MSLFRDIPIFLSLAAIAVLAVTPLPAEAHELDAPVLDAIHTALDDEHKAWSTYNAILQKHGDVRPFSNIIHAEKRHAIMLGDLLIRYRQAIPQNPYETGAKSTPVAPNSLREACKIGVKAEIENIALYNNELLPVVKNYPDIEATLVQLRDASGQRHLPAFKRCVSRGGMMGGGHGRQGGHSRQNG